MENNSNPQEVDNELYATIVVSDINNNKYESGSIIKEGTTVYYNVVVKKNSEIQIKPFYLDNYKCL